MTPKLSSLLIMLALLSAQKTLAVVGFTVSPATVSNTYDGYITLQVTGLASGDTVTVQKFRGAAGQGGALWQQFNLTDGASFVIGGVTNLAVPGDTDSTAGQITAKLNFQSDFSQTIVGTYFFVLTSPAGHFAPLTNSFTVTNFPFGQQFTGTVVSNGVPVTNAAVILFAGSGSHDLTPEGGALADSAGAYTIQAPPGAYTVVPFAPGFLAGLKTAPTLNLGNNADISTNLSLLPTTETISGQVVDANNSSVGLPGLLFTVQSEDGTLLGITETDPNGNFTAGVISNQWKIEAQSAGVAFHGYVELGNKLQVDTTTGSKSGVTLALPKATALFYGTLLDASGNPLPGSVQIEAYDGNNNQYQSDGDTDGKGRYFTGAVGGLGSGDLWWVDVDNKSSFPNDIFSQALFDQSGGANISAGQAVEVNLVALSATNYVTGNVTYNGSNLAGVGVGAYATINGANFNLNLADTDANGNYSLAVGNGTWNVFVSCQGGSDSLNNLIANGNYQCPNNDVVTINNNNGMANFAVQPGNSGGQPTLYGNVTSTGGNSITGVNVYANDGNGNNYTATTDQNGSYGFQAGNGTWVVSVDCGGLNAAGYACVSEQVTILDMSSAEVDFSVPPGKSSTPVGITTSFLPDGLVGAFFTRQLFAVGGLSPYVWSLDASSVELPPGLSISSNGVVSGLLVTADLGTNYFIVDAADGMGHSAQQSLSLAVFPTLELSTNNLPNGTVGVPYEAQITLTGGDFTGNSAVGFGVSSGSLPPGLGISLGPPNSNDTAVFIISGTPTNGGTYLFTFRASDSSGNDVQSNYSIFIGASSLQITTPAALPIGIVGVPYTNQLQASGGATPYTWSIANGSQQPPANLTLSLAGLLSGVPAVSGTHSFIVKLTDHNLITTTRPFTLVVNPKPSLSEGVKSAGRFQFLVSGASNQNYTVEISTNLAAGWTELLTTNSAMTNSFLIVDPNAANPARFYRILLGP